MKLLHPYNGVNMKKYYKKINYIISLSFSIAIMFKIIENNSDISDGI